MRFYFDTVNAAFNNCLDAHIRETTRMLCIAEALKILGHDVEAKASDNFKSSGRAAHFSVPLTNRGVSANETLVISAEACLSGNLRNLRRIGIKTSVGVQNDKALSRCFELVLAHEFDRPRDNYVPVPFLVHDRLLAEWMGSGLFSHYLNDNIDTLRAQYESRTSKLLGFCGFSHPVRRAFTRDAPGWADITYYETHRLSAAEHARWLCGFRGGLLLPGDTPKTNLHGLLAILGRVIVAPPQERQCEPPLDQFNSVVFESWEQVHAILSDESRCNLLAAKATEDYKRGWSPLGQARLIEQGLQ